MGNPERLSQSQIPELVVGVQNLAAASVCKDHADAVYFSLDRFSLRAGALREHVGKRWIVGLLSVMEKKRQHIMADRAVLATWARARNLGQTIGDGGEAERLNTYQKVK